MWVKMVCETKRPLAETIRQKQRHEGNNEGSGGNGYYHGHQQECRNARKLEL